MSKLPSQMIPDMLNWRQIWGSIRPRKGSNSAETVLRHPCHVRPSIFLLKNGSWEPLQEGQHMWLQDIMDMARVPHSITPAVKAVCPCKANSGLRHSPSGLPTRTRLPSLLRLNLDSSLKTTWFHSAAQSSFLVSSTTPNGGVEKGASRAAHVMGTVIPNVLQPDAFVWFQKRQGPLVKVLPLPGWRPMKQLALRVNFVRCCGPLDDWSVAGVLSLVFV
ncbi:e3 ubiquitin-protein ligase RNF13 [Trichonephila clavipes]|nr:e3 ubiquitin-protein ligase RNF13 [Trichonephila clavipes]